MDSDTLRCSSPQSRIDYPHPAGLSTGDLRILTGCLRWPEVPTIQTDVACSWTQSFNSPLRWMDLYVTGENIAKAGRGISSAVRRAPCPAATTYGRPTPPVQLAQTAPDQTHFRKPHTQHLSPWLICSQTATTCSVVENDFHFRLEFVSLLRCKNAVRWIRGGAGPL